MLASVRAGNFSIRKLKSTITFDGKGIFTIGKKLLVDKNLEWALQRGGQGPGKAPNKTNLPVTSKEPSRINNILNCTTGSRLLKP